MSPTALTLRYFRRAGFLADVVERFIHGAGAQGRGIRLDLFGCIDLVAITIDEPIIGVQATSLSNVSARVKKAQGCPALAVWLRTGAKFQVFGWTLVAGAWVPKIVELRAGDLEATVLSRPPRKRTDRFHHMDLFQGDETNEQEN